MKKVFLFIFIPFIIVSLCGAQVKKADLAGRWYSASKDVLASELQSYLRNARPPEINGEIIALISPHAGFPYSGPIAAYGFDAVRDKKADIKTVVIIGFSHRRHYEGIAVFDGDGFQTPLGVVGIERDITEALIAAEKNIYSYPVAFSGENSIETQIPFLQMVLKDFKIVLIAMGEQDSATCRVLGDALYAVLKDKRDILLVASTDMSHYLPYNKARRVDKSTISAIKKFDPDLLYRESQIAGHRLMCGYGAVSATMIAARKLGADKIEVLKYANSGDTAGSKDNVVGYLSAVMIKSALPGKTGPVAGEKQKAGVRRTHAAKNNGTIQGEGEMLTEEQKDKMLKLARKSIINYLKSGKKLAVKETDSALNNEMGAFVTLHKRGQLRGCIGNLVGRGPFYLTVRDMAVEAAVADPRFQPVTLDEMEEIDIEISALSPMEKINNPEIIEVGKHGVLVRRGFASGVYLPQVATETGWNREQFMNSLCGQKAGMPSNAWKKGECDIYIFTALVFDEKEKKH